MYTEISKVKNDYNWKYSRIWEYGQTRAMMGIKMDDKNNIAFIEYSFMIHKTQDSSQDPAFKKYPLEGFRTSWLLSHLDKIKEGILSS